jgi:tetratricopeptide (TPR) repeat protein
VAVLVSGSGLAEVADPESANESEPTSIEIDGGDGPIDLIGLEKDRRQRIRLHPVAPRVGRYLEAANQLRSEDENDEALEMLFRLNPKRLNPNERAQLFNMIAYVYYGESEYEKAIEYFGKVLEQESLFLGDEARLRYNIAQLYGALQQWQGVIDSIHVWFRYVPEPSPNSFNLLAIAHYQLGELDDALLWAGMAVDFSPTPKEGWLQMLAALYVQSQDYDSAAPVFEELVTLFPKREYWVQLSLIYGARESYRHSLAVQQIAYLQGFLTKGSELKRLARSYLYADLPHEAATVLETGLQDGTIEPDSESYELLANSLIQAREFERSLVPLAQAAELADDGKLYVRLGQVHMQREEWSEAVELFDRAVEKGGLENPGFTQLLIGISYYNDDKVNQARSSFTRARKHEKTRKQADEWITHIVNEANNSG